MTPIKLVIVKFAAGTRGDFVAGWLGKLPKFVESYWSFNPISGQSVSMNQHKLYLDSNTGLTTFLKDMRFVLDPAAEYSYATGVKYISPYFETIVNHPAIQILKISVNDADVGQLNWECIIKVNTRYNFGEGWYIDRVINKSEISDSDRVDALHKILSTTMSDTEPTRLRNYLTGIEYNDLFQPGGSYHVTNALGINVDAKYHDYWDYMLPLAQTPDEVSIWGHVFRKKDYIIDLIDSCARPPGLHIPQHELS